jgi:hypothetical protein
MGGKPGGGGGGSKAGGGGGGGSGKGAKPGKGAADDKADPNKADFSAYWSLRFREFFSGRRQYLELARKRDEAPEALQKVDAQMKEQLARFEAATQAKRCGAGRVWVGEGEKGRHSCQRCGRFRASAGAVLPRCPGAAAGPPRAPLAHPPSLPPTQPNPPARPAPPAHPRAPGSDMAQQAYQEQVAAEALAVYKQLGPEDVEEMNRMAAEGLVVTPRRMLEADLDAARGHLSSRRVKVFSITPLQLRAAARALVSAPLALPAAALAAWQALFSKQRYEAFLLAEGERVWYWRNRMENERWFWEVFLMDRLLLPTAFTLAYLYLVPNNLLWAVAVPLLAIFWNTGSLPHPGNLQWWLIMVFGLYGKCWPQVCGAAGALLAWW